MTFSLVCTHAPFPTFFYQHLPYKGVARGVVNKTPICFTLEILSWVRFPAAPPSKLLQAAVWRKRDYKSSLQQLSKDSLPIPPPKQQLASLCFIHTNLTNTPTYQTNQRVALSGIACQTNCSVCFIGSLCQIRSMSLIM